MLFKPGVNNLHPTPNLFPSLCLGLVWLVSSMDFPFFSWVIMACCQIHVKDSNTNDRMTKELSYRGLTSRSSYQCLFEKCLGCCCEVVCRVHSTIIMDSCDQHDMTHGHSSTHHSRLTHLSLCATAMTKSSVVNMGHYVARTARRKWTDHKNSMSSRIQHNRMIVRRMSAD